MSAEAGVAERVAAIEERIAAACRRAGRRRDEVTLVAASKGQPVARLAAAYGAGVRDFGENRVQEGLAKAPALPADTVWHLLGPLQSNKVRAAAGLFTAVQAVDRGKIARLLAAEGERRRRPVVAFLEVNLGGEASKHGFTPAGLAAEAAPLAALPGLSLAGLMAIPPPEEDRERTRAWFRRLRELRDELAATCGWAPGGGALSMGMSDDFEIAVEEGATHVRVGTALFGPRPG